jgi:hypothetical protein
MTRRKCTTNTSQNEKMQSQDCYKDLADVDPIDLELIYIISRHFVILRAPVCPGYPTQQFLQIPSLFNACSVDLSSVPVLLDVERPLELQVGVVVIVDELGDGLVVAAAEHARGSGFRFDWTGC